MRKLKSIFLALGATALLGACSSDRDTYDGFDHSGKNTVSFATNIMKSNIATRATDTDWTKNDAIGVYALNAGGQLGDGAIFDGKANIKHTTAVGGKTAKFIAGTPSEAIQLDGKTPIDVVAYYPFAATVTDYKLPINVKDQSNPEALDILYSNDLKGIQKSGEATMNFSHKLSKLVFSVEPTPDYPNLDGLSAKDIKGLKAEGSFDLKTAEVSLSGDVVTLQPKVNGTSVTAIVVPGQKLDKTVSMVFTLGGEEFTWTPKKDFDLTSSNKYTFRIQLSKDGTAVTLNPEGTIEDWTEGNTDGGVDIVTPGGEDPNPQPGEAMPIADFAKKYASATAESPINITEETKLRGIVTSDDTAANVYMKLYLEDATGAITVGVNSKTIAQEYQRGQEIEIDVKGLDAIVYGGVLQVGLKDAKSNRIEMTDLKARTKVIEATAKPLDPKVTTLNNIKSEMVNTLIKLENVLFVDGGKLTYAEPQKNTNRDLSDGTNTIIVRNSGYSTFAGETLPEGPISVTALLDQFDGKWQLTLRDLNDVVKGGETPEPGKDVTVDKTNLDFAKDAASQTFNVKADVETSWTIENGDSWLTISPKAGKGDQAISVNATQNTGDTRTAKIIVKGGKQDIVVNVSQAGNSQPGVETNIFTETFGKDNKVSKPWKKLANYTNYDNSNLNFTDPKNNTDIRSTKALDNHVWLPATAKGGDLVIDGFDTTGFVKLRLDFDVTSNLYDAGSSFDIANLGVYFDDQKVEVPSKVLTKTDGYFDSFYTVELKNLPTNFKTIKFTVEKDNLGTRITNIKLFGTK